MGATLTQTRSQMMGALELANECRVDRARLLAQLRRGDLDAARMVLEPPACLRGMFTFDFLRAVPSIRGDAIRMLNKRAIQDRVNLAVSLAALTPLSRRWLVEALASRCWRQGSSGVRQRLLDEGLAV